MTTRGALVVIGIGPGIGRAVTTKFASEGFERIFIMSRSAERLEEEKAAVLRDTGNKNVKIDSIVVDVSDPKSLAAGLKEVDDSGDVVEMVYYNAAKVAPSALLDFPVESMEEDWKVAQWFIPRVLDKAKFLKRPTFIVTNSALWKAPIAAVFSLSMTKASQRVLVECLNQTYAPHGIHCGLISVSGSVTPENKVLNPTNIAGEAWKFFESGKPEDLEVELWETERPSLGH